MKLLLTLLFTCVHIPRSHQILRFSAEPVKVEIGVSKSLELRCFLPPNNGSLDLSVASLMISRANSTHVAHFQELVSVTAPNKIHSLTAQTFGNATVTGQVSAQGESYILLSWQAPNESAVGLYKCGAFGVDDMGHPAELIKYVLVSVESPNMDTFSDRIRELTEATEKMRKYYDYLSDKLDAAATLLK